MGFLQVLYISVTMTGPFPQGIPISLSLSGAKSTCPVSYGWQRMLEELFISSHVLLPVPVDLVLLNQLCVNLAFSLGFLTALSSSSQSPALSFPHFLTTFGWSASLGLQELCCFCLPCLILLAPSFQPAFLSGLVHGSYFGHVPFLCLIPGCPQFLGV